MRILMVKCSSFNREVPQISYPLGLMYLASYLRSLEKSHEIELLDLRCHPEPFTLLKQRLSSSPADMVAVSALTCEAASMHRVAAETKASDRRTAVVVGGPHISACTADVIADGNIDVLVTGEGEESFAAVVRAVEGGGDRPEIPGVGWRTDGQVAWGPPRQAVSDVDALPFPAWDLVDINLYARRGRAGNLKRGRFLPLFTSRGCPYQCFYCHNLFGKQFRPRSAENVVEEAREIVGRFGIRDIEVYDDIFNLDLPRAKAICEGLCRMDGSFQLAFPNGVRADRLDRELVSLMADAGTTNLAVAVETASSRLQKLIHKHLDIERVREAITWADADGIVTNGYFMLGFPTETAEEMEATISYAVATDLFFASFFIVTPYPGTPLWDETVGPEESATLDFGKYNYLSGYFNLSAVSGEELRRLQRRAYRRFYAAKAPKILMGMPRLRIDWSNAAWLWFRRMRDKGRLSSSVES
ncbi:B12-binding domain-containing radical SAM protein [Candidatus Fermentibacteria bacterium]|nr:B12-binding domain-containing radical SAM protein [Candidatus Fermentibacteria bacterium]